MFVRASAPPIRQPRQDRIADKWPQIIQEWLFPPTCLLCGDPGDQGRDLCRPCAAALPYIAVACPRCARPLAAPPARLCGRCLRRLPLFDAAHAPLRYAPANEAGYLVQALKFHRHHPCARLLGELLADSLAGRAALPTVLLPVPLHPSRYRERGFNQSAEIARFVSRRLSIPLDLHACRRVRATTAQARLASARERRQNLREAFAVDPGLGHRHVAIIDDVITSGATANELARSLGRAGVERIEVWACARTGIDPGTADRPEPV